MKKIISILLTLFLCLGWFFIVNIPQPVYAIWDDCEQQEQKLLDFAQKIMYERELKEETQKQLAIAQEQIVTLQNQLREEREQCTVNTLTSQKFLFLAIAGILIIGVSAFLFGIYLGVRTRNAAPD